MNWYVLNKKHEIVKTDDMEIVDDFFMSVDKCCVAKNIIGGVKISTVFSGIAHNSGEVPPVLFETMIFGGKHDNEQWRYTTWDLAVEGHKKAVELVKG